MYYYLMSAPVSSILESPDNEPEEKEQNPAPIDFFHPLFWNISLHLWKMIVACSLKDPRFQI